MPHARARREPDEAPPKPETVRAGTSPEHGPPPSPLGPAGVRELQRTAGNAAVSRLLAQQREAQAPPPPAPAPAPRRLQRTEYGVVPELEAADKNVKWWDPADKTAKPVWTPEAGYTKNPSAKMLTDVVGANGKVGGGFQNGTFTYVVDKDGQVVVAKRLGEPGTRPDRARGMPHPTLIGGKKPTVLAAGEVEMRGGLIYRIDNQSGHFLPPRKSMSATMKAFMRLPAAAFHKDFHAQSVHYDAQRNRTTKPFRSLRTLKLKARDFKKALRGLKPRAILSKFKGPKGRSFRSGAKTAGGGLAGVLVMIALNYFVGKLMEDIWDDFISDQIDSLAPKVEEALAAQEDELEALLEEDSEAPFYINVRFSVDQTTRTVLGDPHTDEVDLPPFVRLDSVGYSRQPWNTDPFDRHQQSCMSRSTITYITATHEIDPKELFEDEAAGTQGAKQPATK